MQRAATAVLLSACVALGACPESPPPEVDGGGDAGEADAGAADAGAADAGVDECERELPPWDAGTSEAPMPEGCELVTEPLDDLFTDTGHPIYEHCYYDALRDPCCGAAECADTDAEVLFLDAILGIAEERGYPPSMQLIVVGASEHRAGAAFLVSIDWLETMLTIEVTANEDGVINEQAIAAEMPLWIPTSMPPIADVWAAVRTCDEDAVPYFCPSFGSYLPIELVGECGDGWLALWDPDVVGSGMSEPVCYPSDLPCCSETELP